MLNKYVEIELEKEMTRRSAVVYTLCEELENSLNHFLKRYIRLRHVSKARHDEVGQRDELWEILLFNNQSKIKIQKFRKYIEVL